MSRDVRPPVQMMQGIRVFPSVSKGDSDIPSSCEMKDKPTFKPLQGNPTLFLVRASCSQLHLRQQTQDPSPLLIPERRLFLRGLWKVGLPVQ